MKNIVQLYIDGAEFMPSLWEEAFFDGSQHGRLPYDRYEVYHWPVVTIQATGIDIPIETSYRWAIVFYHHAEPFRVFLAHQFGENTFDHLWAKLTQASGENPEMDRLRDRLALTTSDFLGRAADRPAVVPKEFCPVRVVPVHSFSYLGEKLEQINQRAGEVRFDSNICVTISILLQSLQIECVYHGACIVETAPETVLLFPEEL